MLDESDVEALFLEVLTYFDDNRSKITPLKVHQILTFGTDSDRFLLGLFTRLASALDADLALAMQPPKS